TGLWIYQNSTQSPPSSAPMNPPRDLPSADDSQRVSAYPPGGAAALTDELVKLRAKNQALQKERDEARLDYTRQVIRVALLENPRPRSGGLMIGTWGHLPPSGDANVLAASRQLAGFTALNECVPELQQLAIEDNQK